MLPRPVLSGKGFPWIERRMRTTYPELGTLLMRAGNCPPSVDSLAGALCAVGLALEERVTLRIKEGNQPFWSKSSRGCRRLDVPCALASTEGV
jgi:hypothetical protein